MTENQSAEFSKLVTDVLAYYRQDTSPFALGVWWAGCAPFSFGQVKQALQNHATDPDKGQFAPKVADLVRILGGTKTDRSLMAWGRVHDAMSDVGAYRDVDFGDDAIHAAVTDMGGWPKMCRYPLSEMGYLQHRFCESYRAYQTAGTAKTAALMGDRSPDEMYLQRGRPVPEPVLIGGGKSQPRIGLARIITARIEGDRKAAA